MSKRKKRHPLYKRFLAAYERDWRSLETQTLALAVKQKFFMGIGQNDALLTQEGKRQAGACGERLARELRVPDAVFLSGAARTEETFSHMALGWPDLGKVEEVHSDNRLREQNHGLITVYSDKAAMLALNPEQKEQYDADGEYYYVYPGGESAPDVELRVRLCLGEINREYAGKSVMLVTHFRTILVIRTLLEGLSPREFIKLNDEEGPINCGVTSYTKKSAGRRGKPRLAADDSGRPVLEYYNKKLYD